MVSLTAQTVRFGIHGGLGYYDVLNYEPQVAVTESSTFGHYAGAFIDYNFKDSYGLVFMLTSKEKNVAFEERLRMAYIDLALLFKFDLDAQYGKGIYVAGGPKISFLGSAERMDVEIEDTFQSTQYGLVMGTGTSLNHFLELELLIDIDLNNSIRTPSQKAHLVGLILALKLELNAILGWKRPRLKLFN